MATNQELEAENTALKDQVQLLQEGAEEYYQAKVQAERACDELKAELTLSQRETNDAQHLRDHYKKVMLKYADELSKAREEKYALEERIQKAMQKALHPDMPDTDKEDEGEGEALKIMMIALPATVMMGALSVRRALGSRREETGAAKKTTAHAADLPSSHSHLLV